MVYYVNFFEVMVLLVGFFFDVYNELFYILVMIWKVYKCIIFYWDILNGYWMRNSYYDLNDV